MRVRFERRSFSRAFNFYLKIALMRREEEYACIWGQRTRRQELHVIYNYSSQWCFTFYLLAGGTGGAISSSDARTPEYSFAKWFE